MVSLLTEPDGFYTEHRECAELDGDVNGRIVWVGCTISVSPKRELTT